MLINILIILIGTSGGIAVGSAIGSFIAVLEIVPRLAQISNTREKIRFYEVVFIVAITSTSMIDLLDLNFSINIYYLLPIGLFLGVFIGMLASALAEVLNVIPIVTKRLDMRGYIYLIIICIMVGKVVGSLVHWLILTRN